MQSATGPARAQGKTFTRQVFSLFAAVAQKAHNRVKPMVPLNARILFFPLASLALGVAYQAVHPDGLWTLRTAQKAYDDGFGRVTWTEAQTKIASGEWLLVDARDEDQFAAEHIPGAVSLPAASYEEMLLFFAEEHGREKPVVIYCGTEDCEMSAELAIRLRDEAGLNEIRILEGGILAWRRAQ
jgi:rhodanese-related sulfurtransferase